MSTLESHVCKPEARLYLRVSAPFGRIKWSMRCLALHERAPKAQEVDVDFCPFCGKRLRDIVVSP